MVEVDVRGDSIAVAETPWLFVTAQITNPRPAMGKTTALTVNTALDQHCSPCQDD